MTEELKTKLKALSEKQSRTAQDLSDLYNTLRGAGISALICGHVKDDTMSYLFTLGRQTKDKDLKQILRTLYSDIEADRFAVPPQPQPRPAPF